jgi:hypothetical protein
MKRKAMTIYEAAQFLERLTGLSVSTAAIRAWLLKDEIPVTRFQGRLIFTEDELRSWVEAMPRSPGRIPVIGDTDAARVTMS